MSGPEPGTWERLAGEPVTGEALRARYGFADVTERIVCALDGEGVRHLLVNLLDSDMSCEDRLSRGVIAETRDLSAPGGPSGRYVDITCAEPGGHSIFDLIGGEIAEQLAHKTGTPAEIIERTLAKYRRFWGQPVQNILSREMILGLFAELHFLCAWMVPAAGAPEAVSRWRGPAGSRHDFEWPGRSVEVKGTTSTRGSVHHINGLEQLAPPESGDLLFFSLRMREEGGATGNLPDMVAACRQAIGESAKALDAFEERLLQSGYTPQHDDEYRKLKVRIVDQGLYRVEDGFPRITPTSLPAGLPAGVLHIEYDIDLSAAQPFLLAREPGILPEI